MKNISKIAQWAVAALFLLLAIGNGFHFSSLFLLLAAGLMMPIPAIRNAMNAKKIKNWIAILLAVILFFTGILLSPLSETPNNPIDETSSVSTSETVTSSNISDTSDITSDSTGSNDKEHNSEETASKPDETSSTPTSTEKPSTSTPNNSTPTSKPSSSTETSSPTTSVGTGTATPVNPSKLPAYSGSPYTIVNGGQPNFSSAELTMVAYETYHNLDSLGRCGAAIASCGIEIMPAADEERGSISSIKPTGWVQAQYDCVSGKYLYNRSHLIGWQLSAENANKKNLITGTRYMNTEGMLPFENMVADYIKETGNHVAYRVTPIFIGNNLLCSGVQMEAYSIEDKGDGICFNVYCYNVQPGVKINYATGSSSLVNESTNNETSSKPTTTTKPETSSKPTITETSSSVADEEMVWIPQSGKKYHSHSGCSNMKNPTEVTKEEAEDLGYDPCKKCYG